MASNGILIVLIEMALVYKLEGRRRNLDYITVGVALVGLSFLLLHIGYPAAVISMLMILLITMGEILSMPFMNSYWISRAHPSNRGQYAGYYTMAWSAAQTLGPMAGALIADYLGFDALFWILSGVCLLAACCFHWLKKR